MRENVVPLGSVPWTPRPHCSPTEQYSTVEDVRRVDYEDLDCYYERLPEPVYHVRCSSRQQTPLSVSPQSLMTTPFSHSTLQRLHHRADLQRRQESCGASQKMLGAGFVLIVLLAIGSVAFLLWQVQSQNASRSKELLQNLHDSADPTHSNQSILHESADFLISPNYLVTLLITKRPVCLFEVSTSETEQSRDDFDEVHIQHAQLVYFSNLSHAGVPVHPLQFQRYARKLGVDSDCHVVLYDRGQLIWSTYALWIFKVSLLSGGLVEWKLLANRQNSLYKLESGPPRSVNKAGNFRAGWDTDTVTTFDDVIANFDTHAYDVVDAQNEEEFEGKQSGAVFGHMKGAVNIPIDLVYEWVNNSWASDDRLKKTFSQKGLTVQRPVLVYDGTSLRSTMVWFALNKVGYNAAIYFGSWPEFVIRAPDILKVASDLISP